MKALLAVLCLAAAVAHADEKTCAVKGVHCADCASTVKEKVCDGKYSTCDVKVLSSKKELGEIHLITKDSKAKIDEHTLGEAIKDVGYSLDKCSTGKPAAAKASKS